MGISPLRSSSRPGCSRSSRCMPCRGDLQRRRHLRHQPDLPRLLQHRLGLFSDLVLSSLLIRDIVTGLIKSFLFGLLIGAVACYRGLHVEGGAAGVGTSTTSSVVTAITAVIAFDTIFNVIYVVFFP
jgi:phospholipid/cholesterol/gamma-HCH transport system permease protein